MAEPAGEHRDLWLHLACENVILTSMNEVSVTVAQLLFCVCLSGGSHVGRQPACDWEDQYLSFLNTFAAQEIGNRGGKKSMTVPYLDQKYTSIMSYIVEEGLFQENKINLPSSCKIMIWFYLQQFGSLY